MIDSAANIESILPCSSKRVCPTQPPGKRLASRAKKACAVLTKNLDNIRPTSKWMSKLWSGAESMSTSKYHFQCTGSTLLTPTPCATAALCSKRNGAELVSPSKAWFLALAEGVKRTGRFARRGSRVAQKCEQKREVCGRSTHVFSAAELLFFSGSGSETRLRVGSGSERGDCGCLWVGLRLILVLLYLIT